VQLLKNEENLEVDFDLDFHMIDVMKCLRANDKFYILSNRFNNNRGVFLMELDENDPCNLGIIDQHIEDPKFLLKS
jgi:hypothetical protein